MIFRALKDNEPLITDIVKKKKTEPLQDAPPSPGCGGAFSYPSQCTDNCEYSATWLYNVQKDELNFEISARTAESSWLGIAFSEDHRMVSLQMHDYIKLLDYHILILFWISKLDF